MTPPPGPPGRPPLTPAQVAWRVFLFAALLGLGLRTYVCGGARPALYQTLTAVDRTGELASRNVDGWVPARCNLGDRAVVPGHGSSP